MGTKNNPGKFDCYEHAEPDEPMFILLGRDPVASILVSLWVELRKAIGDGNLDKLREAETCGQAMVAYLNSDKLPMKGSYTRFALFRKALDAIRTNFGDFVHEATRNSATNPAQAYYSEVDRIIKNNTGIVKRAENGVALLLEKGHTYESARAQLLKDVHEDVVLVHLVALDRACGLKS